MDSSIIGSGGGAEGGGMGMGNLADELADAFSDSGEDDEGEFSDGDVGAEISSHGKVDDKHEVEGDEQGADRNLLNPPSPQRKNHQRKTSDYDGSDYGSETDLDTPGIPPSLVARIDAIESLARRGTESYGGPAEDVCQRVIDGLRDLGSQSTVEGSASR